MSLTDVLTIRPILKRLDRLTEELQRLADLYELSLADKSLYLRPPKADTSGDEPEAMYQDEELDAVREMAELIKKGEKSL